MWATEFSKESSFYAQESAITANATLKLQYAQEAYTAAAVAARISSDMMLIHSDLIPQYAAPQAGASPYGGMEALLLTLILIVNVAILLLLTLLYAHMCKRDAGGSRTRGRRGKMVRQ